MSRTRNESEQARGGGGNESTKHIESCCCCFSFFWFFWFPWISFWGVWWLNDEATNKQKKKKKNKILRAMWLDEWTGRFRFEVLYRSDFYLDDLTPTSRALLLNDSVDEPLLLAFRVGWAVGRARPGGQVAHKLNAWLGRGRHHWILLRKIRVLEELTSLKTARELYRNAPKENTTN